MLFRTDKLKLIVSLLKWHFNIIVRTEQVYSTKINLLFSSFWSWILLRVFVNPLLLSRWNGEFASSLLMFKFSFFVVKISQKAQNYEAPVADGITSSQTGLDMLPVSMKTAQGDEWFPIVIGWLCYFLVSVRFRTVGLLN